MASNWFVRPDTSHNSVENRTGVSFEEAWGGWAEVVWGTGGILAGDTLYVCDAHTYSTILSTGGQVATQTDRITVRGDYSGHPGSITYTPGAYYLDANRNFMTFTDLAFVAGDNACISPGGAPNKELKILNCSFVCAAEPAIKFRAFSGWAYEDTLIDGNSFTGGNAPTLGGCIQWFVTGALSSTIKRLTISNNYFSNNTARATVMLKAKYGTALETCTIEDLIVYGNRYENCNGVALEAECKKTVSSVIVGACKGIKIHDNIVLNQGLSDILGGGFVPSGFELSTTPDFGTNDIFGNWCSGLHGLTGFCNPLYGTYRIFNNYADNISTIDIDGCGVLPDHGCHDTEIFGNEFRDIHGDGSETYSATGFGILILDATNIVCYGNLIVNCQVGIGFGNKTDAASDLTQSSDVHNNTFINCAQHAVYLVGGANNTGNDVRNNIFTSRNALPAVQVDSAAWTGEASNCFHGFDTPVNHTLSASSITSDPQLSDVYQPTAAECISTGVALGRRDFYGRLFYTAPNLGAIERNPSIRYKCFSKI